MKELKEIKEKLENLVNARMKLKEFQEECSDSIMPDEEFFSIAEKRGHYTKVNGEVVQTERGKGYMEGMHESLMAYTRNPERFKQMAAIHAAITLNLSTGRDLLKEIEI